MKVRNVLVGAVAVAGVGLMGTSASALQFDPDGLGGGSANLQSNVGGFDFLPGAAYSEFANQAAINVINDLLDDGDPTNNSQGQETFTTYFHAKVSLILDDGGGGLLNPASIGKEITAVARFDEVITLAVPGTAVFAYTPSAGEFLEIWIHDAPDANNLAGTGFNNGELILSADITTATSNFSLITNAAGEVIRDDLDTTGDGDQYPNVDSVTGTGSTQLTADTISFSTDHFSAAPGQLIFDLFSTTQTLPFGSVNPSDAFVRTAGGAAPISFGVGAGVAGVGIGAVNGDTSFISLSAFGANPALPAVAPLFTARQGGPDIIFQTDASMDLSGPDTFIPEPITASLGMMGLGSLALSVRRRRVV